MIAAWIKEQGGLRYKNGQLKHEKLQSYFQKQFDYSNDNNIDFLNGVGQLILAYDAKNESGINTDVSDIRNQGYEGWQKILLNSRMITHKDVAVMNEHQRALLVYRQKQNSRLSDNFKSKTFRNKNAQNRKPT